MKIIVSRNFQNNAGFTLIETLLVVGILGIVAGVGVSVINTQQKKADAEDTVKRSNIEKIVLGVKS